MASAGLAITQAIVSEQAYKLQVWKIPGHLYDMAGDNYSSQVVLNSVNHF